MAILGLNIGLFNQDSSNLLHIAIAICKCFKIANHNINNNHTPGAYRDCLYSLSAAHLHQVKFATV